MNLLSSAELDQKKIRAIPWYLAHTSLTSIFFLWTLKVAPPLGEVGEVAGTGDVDKPT